jgi:hypothetical protein
MGEKHFRKLLIPLLVTATACAPYDGSEGTLSVNQPGVGGSEVTNHLGRHDTWQAIGINEIAVSDSDFTLTPDPFGRWLENGLAKKVVLDRQGIPTFLSKLDAADREDKRQAIFNSEGVKLFETANHHEDIIGFDAVSGLVVVRSNLPDPDNDVDRIQEVFIYNYLENKKYQVEIPEGGSSVGNSHFDPTTQKMSLSFDVYDPVAEKEVRRNLLYDYSDVDNSGIKFWAFLPSEEDSVVGGLQRGVAYFGLDYFSSTPRDMDKVTYFIVPSDQPNPERVGLGEYLIDLPDGGILEFDASSVMSEDYIFGPAVLIEDGFRQGVGFSIYSLREKKYVELRGGDRYGDNNTSIYDPDMGRYQSMWLPVTWLGMGPADTYKIFGDQLVVISEEGFVVSVSIASVFNPDYLYVETDGDNAEEYIIYSGRHLNPSIYSHSNIPTGRGGGPS